MPSSLSVGQIGGHSLLLRSVRKAHAGLSMLSLIAPLLLPFGAAEAQIQAPGNTPATSAPVHTGPPIVADPWAGKKKLLIYADVTTGLHHDSISHAIATIERLGRQTGEWVTIIKTDSQSITKKPIVGQGKRYAGKYIYARNLDFYDAIFFLGSGEGTLDAQQKADLLSFVKDDGKGFVAGHAATVAFDGWPEFIDMIGGSSAETGFQVRPMAILNIDRSFPGAAAFPKHFLWNEQFPVMRPSFSSKDVHVILRLDPAKLTPQEQALRPDGDIPVVWAKDYGKGRVYNLSAGHREESWDDPKFQKLVTGAIRWALGLEPAKAEPGNGIAPSP